MEPRESYKLTVHLSAEDMLKIKRCDAIQVEVITDNTSSNKWFYSGEFIDRL